jgi:CRISPR-associated protein Csa2
MFASIAFRFRVEVEALNMVEALGAYTRHRTVSVFKRVERDGKPVYKVMVVPAISGQSIANGYQRMLVELALRLGLPVCDQCRRYESIGGFIKHSTESKESKVEHDSLIESCVVEDLTGFLIPMVGIRRTSAVMFSYLVPDTESAKAVLESQFHVRYNFETGEHNPFNIESGSAIYMLTVGIDIDKIGKRSNGNLIKDKAKRVELAFKALEALIEGLNFGAKKARYLPISEVLGAIGAISDPIPFMVSPSRVYVNGDNYISKTITRASKYIEALRGINERIYLAYMDNEGLNISTPSNPKVEVVRTSTVAELIETLINIIGKLQGISK